MSRLSSPSGRMRSVGVLFVLCTTREINAAAELRPEKHIADSAKVNQSLCLRLFVFPTCVSAGDCSTSPASCELTQLSDFLLHSPAQTLPSEDIRPVRAHTDSGSQPCTARLHHLKVVHHITCHAGNMWRAELVQEEELSQGRQKTDDECLYCT